MLIGSEGITAARREAVTRGLSRTFGASIASEGCLNFWLLIDCALEGRILRDSTCGITAEGSYTWGNSVALRLRPRGRDPKGTMGSLITTAKWSHSKKYFH